MANVRAAVPADLPMLVALGRMMHAEAPALKHAEFDAGKVERLLHFALDHGICLVHTDQEGQIDGAFAALVVERWFSCERVLSDLGLFVRPDRRGGLVAFRLVEGLITWCALKGMRAEDVVLGISTGVEPKKTGEFLERLGFVSIGGNYQLKGY